MYIKDVIQLMYTLSETAAPRPPDAPAGPTRAVSPGGIFTGKPFVHCPDELWADEMQQSNTRRCCTRSRHRIPKRNMDGLQRMLWEFSAAKSLHPTRCLHVRHDILTSNSWQHRCDRTCDLPPIYDAIEERLGTENARKIPSSRKCLWLGGL